MNAIFDRVIVLNLIANTAIFYVAARLYLLPLISRVSLQLILVPILLFHSMRHLGMMFVTRGASVWLCRKVDSALSYIPLPFP